MRLLPKQRGREFRKRNAHTLSRDIRHFERLRIALTLDKRLDPFEVARVHKLIDRVTDALRVMLAQYYPGAPALEPLQFKRVG